MIPNRKLVFTLVAAMTLSALPLIGEEVSEAGEFRIDLPAECGHAQRQAQTVESPSGPIDNVTWVARGDSGICIFTYSELSGPIIDPDSMIDSGRDSLMKELGTTVQAERAVDVAGFPGRTIEYAGAKGNRSLYGRTDFAVAHDRMYQVIFIGYSINDRAAVQSSSYFSSIEIEAPDLASDATEVVPADEPSSVGTASSENADRY